MKALAGPYCGRPVVATFTCLRVQADHLPLCQTHLREAMTNADTQRHAYKARHTPYVTSGCHYIEDLSGCRQLMPVEATHGR